MSRLLAGAPPLPAAVLGAIAVALAATGVGPVASVALGFAAVGALVGVAAAAVFFRSTASALQDELIRLADGTLQPRPAPGRFGPPGPIARGLINVSDALRAAQQDATTDRLTHLMTRPTLLAQLFQEVDRAARYSAPASAAPTLTQPPREAGRDSSDARRPRERDQHDPDQQPCEEVAAPGDQNHRRDDSEPFDPDVENRVPRLRPDHDA